MSGILTGPGIEKASREGRISISRKVDGRYVPVEPNSDGERPAGPASYDLTLGRTVSVYKAVTEADFSGSVPGALVRPSWGSPYSSIPFRPSRASGPPNYLDAASENEVASYEMDDRGLLLMPGVGYLMHTEERVKTDRFVPIVDGKSSIGRLFCQVHWTAGFGDPGFDGQYTLEVAVLAPLRLYPGMRICQIRFHTTEGGDRGYARNGTYVGDFSEGPVPSRSWKMFNVKD
jgi:dCTP deaminase